MSGVVPAEELQIGPSGGRTGRLRWVFAVLLLTALVGTVTRCGGTRNDRTTDAPNPGVRSTPLPALWHLLYLGDVQGSQIAKRYAQRAEKALGVHVVVTELGSPLTPAPTILDLLRAAPGDTVSHAEIIVVTGTPGPAGREVSWPCRFDLTPAGLKVYSVTDWKPYRAQLDALYREIWKLRNGIATIMRAVDYYAPLILEWRKAGIERQCTANYESMSRTIRQAAHANGAVMVSAYDALNGPRHQQDPRARGYVAHDGFSTTAKGAAVIADLLAATGFQPTPPASEPISPDRTP
jgi:hypothetical protein